MRIVAGFRLFLSTPMTTRSAPEWYNTWFGTHYYDLLYGHRDEQEAAAFVQALLQHLQPTPHATVLDAACGKGRHAILLAEAGLTVTGIDLSYGSISEALAYETADLSFFQHDMRKIFRVRYFDLICNFYTSFGYFENPADDLACIRSFAAGLKPGGKLVIDFLNIYHTLQHLVEDESREIDGIHFIISKSFVNGFLLKKITVIDGDKTHVYEEKVRALERKHFEQYFEKCGLRLMDVFGDYKLSPFHRSSSDRLILIATN